MISSTYRWRLCLIGAMCLVWGVWSLYDGFIGYPEHNRRVALFEQTKTAHPDDWRDEWVKLAKEHRWSIDEPGPLKSDFDINTQFVMIVLTFPVGLFYAVLFLTSFRRWVASDEQGLLTSSGQRAPFASITKVNKDRWQDKGIAKVFYLDAQKTTRKIVLDDWKYEPAPTKAMLKEVESHLKPEQIVGGVPAEPASPQG